MVKVAKVDRVTIGSKNTYASALEYGVLTIWYPINYAVGSYGMPESYVRYKMKKLVLARFNHIDMESAKEIVNEFFTLNDHLADRLRAEFSSELDVWKEAYVEVNS